MAQKNLIGENGGGRKINPSQTLSLPKKKKFFFGRLPLLPGSLLGQDFGPYGDYFSLIAPQLDP